MTDDRREAARDLLRRLKLEEIEPEDVGACYDMLGSDDVGVQRLGVSGLRTVAGRRRQLLDDVVDDDLATLRSLCTHDDASVRAGAVSLLGSVWTPDRVPAEDAVAIVRPLLHDDDELVRGNAVDALAKIASADADAVTSVVEDVVPLIDLTGDYRKAAVTVVASAATADGTSVLDVLDRLVELLESDVETADGPPLRELSDPRYVQLEDRVRGIQAESLDDHRFVRRMSGHAIVEVAADAPEAVLPLVHDLAEHLRDVDPQIRHVAADAFVALGESHPGVVARHADALAGVLQPDEADFVLDSALRALAAASATDAGTVAGAVGDDVDLLHARLDDDEPTTRGAAATLLAVLADDDPTVVEPAVDRLRELATDDVDYVRAAAADALQTVE